MFQRSKIKQKTIGEKREKTINNLIMKKYPKTLDKIESKFVNESIKSEFLDYFPLGNKPIDGVKVTIERFLTPQRRIVYWPLSEMHKNEIKHKILMFHYINQH
jgi:hypothetical protein